MKRSLVLMSVFWTLVFAQEIGARYLIITDDSFYDAIQPLAEWKHRTGLRTKVVRLSEIGSSMAAIKAYVDSAYDTWEIRPEFLLLVGSPYHIPFYVFSYYCYSDNFYTNMDSHIYNEILSGRLTVHNAAEAQTVVNKILLYEKTPDLTDSLWFINACLIVNEDYYTYPPPPYGDDSIYWSDIRHAKGLMLANEYNTIDTLSDLLGNHANDVITSVNQGRAFVLYRGCGTNNWSPPFDVEPNQTQNGTRLPIVLSITCGTIGTGYSPAAAERWLLTGSPSLPRGGAGYFATTTSGMGIAHLRSAVCKGFFNGLFQQGKRTFGEACEAGRKNVYDLYSNTYEYRGFTTLGDPAMNIWTAIPRPLEVSHDSFLPVYDDSLVIGVCSQDAPVESALVCVILDTIVYEYGFTNNTGEIVFNFDTLTQGYMHVTVTAHNKIPYLDSIQVGLTYVEEAVQPTTTPLFDIEVAPNPFHHETDIRYQITDNGYKKKNMGADIKIFDASGRLVRDFELSSAIGYQLSVRWDGTDNAGRKLPGGVYFLSISNANTMPIILIR